MSDASLEAEARRRYLNYALSVITSRALPDVRDGLKPVQRRILYAMLHDNHLRPDAKHRKSAKVVGDVIGKYHPHGDTRGLRRDGPHGAGLGAARAARRRLGQLRLARWRRSRRLCATPSAGSRRPRWSCLRELDFDTVDMRANYDGTTEEPTVLPARFPNLLVNGSTGIAVGMATNIPPHNLREVIDALIALSKDRKIEHVTLMKHINGPDFPTGGQMLNSKVELRQIYKDGAGHDPRARRVQARGDRSAAAPTSSSRRSRTR